MTAATDSGNGKNRRLSESYVNQINVLESLSGEFSSNTESLASESSRHFQISEIAEKTGLGDEKEIQRYLFILEGQKLVAPHPEGDFTSKTWQITKNGRKALKTIRAAA